MIVTKNNLIKKFFSLLLMVGFVMGIAACSDKTTEETTTYVTIAGMQVSSIAVTGADNASVITIDGGTLQMSAAILPTTAANKLVTWSVTNGTGMAEINATGLLTALTDGTVTVKATSVGTPTINGTKVITISNQEEVAQANPVDLGSADDFVILAKTGISTATSSVITGDIGVSPSPASYITGFSLIMDAAGVFSTSSQVTGHIFAADYTSPTPANLTAAIGDMELAYTDAAGRAPDFTELYAGDVSGKTLAAGVYKWTTDLLVNTDLTLNGSSTDVWIFQISGSYVQAAGIDIILSGGAIASNVFFQVAGDASIGTGAHFAGIMLCMTSIAVGTNASVNGKLFAQTAVTLDANQIVG
jgi:hypothetical protein